jgi:hypothetical protein
MLFIFLNFTTKEFIVIAASIDLLTLKRFLVPQFSHVNLSSCVQFIFLLEWHTIFVCVCVCVCVCFGVILKGRSLDFKN